MTRLRDRRGQALVEMALVLPVLLLLIMGTISYGLYINAVDTVEQATRLGVRAATLGDTMGCPADSAEQELAQGSVPTVYGVVDDQLHGNRWIAGDLNSTPISLATVIGSQSNGQQDTVLLTVAIPYHPLVPIPALLPATLEIAQTYEMMVQNPQPSNATTSSEPVGSPYYESSAWTTPAPPTSNVSYLVQPGGC